ncbi:unnamed protein product [Rotaria sordida]|uniref:TRAF1-6 MATH domain-containing protein n=1 Tax=Rotaria sordida TaxID=392033 RepID=A0A814QCF8_9BILA|nr:unnamed protein product [Rotaria sordida]
MTSITAINENMQRLAEVQSEKQTSIMSPTGYKMCASLFLNENGDAECTHMSIFSILFKGDYDAILWWPFYIPVVYCLFDQTG